MRRHVWLREKKRGRATVYEQCARCRVRRWLVEDANGIKAQLRTRWLFQSRDQSYDRAWSEWSPRCEDATPAPGPDK